MDRMIEFFVKCVLVLIFGPVLLGIALQWFTAAMAAILPWLIFGALAIAAVIGLVAGGVAAFVLRQRLPPPQRAFPRARDFGEPIRRPRGRGRDA